MQALARAAAQPNINGRRFKASMSRFRRSTEQAAIVDELDAPRDETQRLESIYQRKLAALEALKKSLLHQAFTGQL